MLSRHRYPLRLLFYESCHFRVCSLLNFLRLPIEAGSQLIGAGFHCFSVFRIFADFFFHNFVVEKILSLREAHERFLTFSIILKPGPSKKKHNEYKMKLTVNRNSFHL